MKLMNSFAGSSLLLGAFSLSVLVGATYASAQEQRKVSHILLVSKAQAEQVRKEVIAGGGDAKAFTAACYKHSKDATTKPLGGNLGFIRQSSGYDPAFSAAAFNLKTGGISEPVLTEFGWHLIHVSEIKAGSAPKKAVAASATGQKTQATSKPPAKPVVVTPAKPAVAPQQTQQQPKDPGAVKAAQAASAAKAATQKAVPKRRPLAVSRKVVLTIESVLSGASPRGSQLSFRKDVAVELNLTLKNEGRTDQRLPSPALLPLGFEVTRLSDNKKMTGDFSAVAEPASYFSTLKSWEITGLAVSLNEYFPSMTPSGRYRLNWSGAAFISNLEARFAKVKDLPDYSVLKAELMKDNSIRTRKVFLDRSANRSSSLGGDFEFSVFGTVTSNVKYYARVNLTTGTDPIVFELSGSKRGNLFAMRQFINLANEGFMTVLISMMYRGMITPWAAARARTAWGCLLFALRT